MHIEDFREYCLSKPGATEDLPFDDDTLVFKVGGKMFALCSLSNFGKGIALKCDPEQAIAWRERHDQVQPGYHMNKKHWNSVRPEECLPESLLKQMIDDSYTLVIASLPKVKRP